MWTKRQKTSNDVLCRAIGHGIIAFDDAEFPITEKQVAAANRGTNEALLGALGIGAGLLGAAGTLCALLSPWTDKHAEEEWQETAITAAAVVMSVTELTILSKFFINRGRQLDRQATIERLKSRNTDLGTGINF